MRIILRSIENDCQTTTLASCSSSLVCAPLRMPRHLRSSDTVSTKRTQCSRKGLATSGERSAATFDKRRGRFVYPCKGRSTAAPGRPGTTARSASSSRRTSSASGGAPWSPAATTSSAWTPRSSCRAQVWVASGHVGTFSDPLVECQSATSAPRGPHAGGLRRRAKKGQGRSRRRRSTRSPAPTAAPATWTEPRDFNMMLKTYLGVIEDESGCTTCAPRPRRASSSTSPTWSPASRKKPPFGIAQIGKSFRNEITPGNFIFRTREFEQMEMEFFVKPGDRREWHKYWIDSAPTGTPTSASTPTTCACTTTRRRSCRTTPRHRPTSSTASASPAADWGELEGIANRTDFDLTTHSEHSGRTCPTSTRPTTSATCPTSSSRRPGSRAA
jgi:hypothetical protein